MKTERFNIYYTQKQSLIFQREAQLLQPCFLESRPLLPLRHVTLGKGIVLHNLPLPSQVILADGLHVARVAHHAACVLANQEEVAVLKAEGIGGRQWGI